jgi:phosphonate transport system ATP-binding protein
MGIRLFEAEASVVPTAAVPAAPDWLQANGSAVLAARDLWLSYDGRHFALRGAQLAVRQGEMAMILGRSGSGKTSLLRVLAGLVKPQRGAVEPAAGAHKNGPTPRARIAYVPQNLGLVRNMTALENALAGALADSNTLLSVFRVFPKAAVERARDTLGTLGLADKLHEKVYSLSGGQRQRVAIARALMQRPNVILADEFVSQLDPITSEEILDMLRPVTRDGVSLLITTHETDVVAKYADRLLVMRDGVIAHEGPAAEVAERAMVEMLR